MIIFLNSYIEKALNLMLERHILVGRQEVFLPNRQVFLWF